MNNHRSCTKTVAALWALAFLCFTLALIFSGCGIVPQRGGKARMSVSVPRAGTIADNPTIVSTELDQPENPKDTSEQKMDIEESSEIVLPAGTVIKQVTGSNTFLDFTIAGPANLKTIRKVNSGTRIGASQEDTAREIGAKLSSMRPIQIMGILLMLGALSMFHPAVYAVVGSRTMQMWTGAVGVLMVFGPVVIVDIAPMIQLAIIVGGVGFLALYYLQHRNAEKSGQVKTLQQTLAGVLGTTTSTDADKIA